MDLKDKLKELRKNKNLTQKELAQLVGLKSDVSYLHWEKGNSEPSTEQLIILADFYSISLDELCGRKTVNSIKLSQEEIDLITELRSLKKSALLKVVGYINGLKEADKISGTTNYEY